MSWIDEFRTADRLREWAFRGLGLRNVVRVSFARTGCVQAVDEARKEGREFTLIYWYFVDPDTTPIMTLWDMNES
jgi:hypothetical protein